MQKITPFLWFDRNCEEAMQYYTSIFPNSKIISIKRYEGDIPQAGVTGMTGKVLTGIFELCGQRFMALDGGPFFKFNPAVSFSVTCKTAAETERYFNKLVEGGMALMPLQKYPFSELYGWCQDKYGVSWQINTGESKQAITPSFMFVGEQFGKAEEAMRFYTSIFKNSSMDRIARYEKGEGDVEGKVKFAVFTLENQSFFAMESSFGHKFKASGAISMYVECADQAEVDEYWEKLTQGGDPAAQQCGWLADRYGFSWQIVPKALGELMEKDKSGRVMQAMLQMKKIDVAGLFKAYQG